MAPAHYKIQRNFKIKKEASGEHLSRSKFREVLKFRQRPQVTC